jgi:uncharacterized protein YdeI (YjbR/CyaY-like superfamily)
MAKLDTLPLFYAPGRPVWRGWLHANHQTAAGVWLVRYRQDVGVPCPGYDEIVEEALCFGWVDSHIRKLDDERSKLLVSPRNPKSGWSRLNQQRVERLVAAGLMAEEGLEAVRRAQASGVWSALDAAEDLLVPPDLAVAFAAAPAALATFEGFTRGSRKIILTWVYGAKRPETRAARVAQTVALAAQGLRANHPQDLQQLRSTSG